MNEFLTRLYEAAFSLPTEPFTWLMMPVTLYWALSLSGLFSLDWMDGAEGALDSLDGALEGAAEGLTEGLGEAAGEGLADVFSSGDALDTTSAAGALDGYVPRTLSWSMIVIFSWIISLSGTLFIPGFQSLATKGLSLALLLAAASLALAMGATAMAMRPIKRALNAGGGTHSSELVGRTCTIRTQRVDRAFGQAEVDDGSMVVQVRSMDPDAAFRYGDKAVIYEYDPAQTLYWVTPLADELTKT